MTQGGRGVIENRHCSPAGQEAYDVRLADGKTYTLAPSEVEEKNNEARTGTKNS
ncbi:unnamed protein product [marine sediment metagenome]|uniref:Uncharacterized protein n=1 Tax=marine sediment metagenome TaxID=412755 RepID=X1UAR1_9ZZZZ